MTHTLGTTKRGPIRQLVAARRRYPIWSAKAILWLSLLVVVVITPLVFLLGKKEIFVEAEITAAILAGMIFIFLAFGLYKGVRVRKSEKFEAKTSELGLDTTHFDVGDWGGNLPDVEGGDDCLGAVVGFVLSLLALIIIGFLLYFAIIWGASLLVVIFAAIYWILHLALRTVFARSRQCRGRLALSLRTAMVYTFFYTSWVFVLLAAGRWMLRSSGV